MTLIKDIKEIETYLKNLKNQQRLQDDSDLNAILSVLQCPVFANIVKIQHSLEQLKREYYKHPSILPLDFDIEPLTGQLLLNLPPDVTQSSTNVTTVEPDYVNYPSQEKLPQLPINDDLNSYIANSARGRDVFNVSLFKSEGGSFGFSVVGLSSELKGDLGIYVENIAPDGIAARDGRLQEGDQILAINGQFLDGDISHDKAISILQNAHGTIEIIVARDPSGTKSTDANFFTSSTTNLSDNLSLPPQMTGEQVLSPEKSSVEELSPSVESSKEAIASLDPNLAEYSQIELVELVNDGTGLGFGIVGGRSTGVVVKTILLGGVSDRDGRLKSGDHILQINDVYLRGMSSEQVAQILRTSGSHVKLLIARQRNVLPPGGVEEIPSVASKTELSKGVISNVSISPTSDESKLELAKASIKIPISINEPVIQGQCFSNTGFVTEEIKDKETFEEPEMESFEVELVKDQQGLGITIAGYVCEKEEISGIFVKSIAKGSAADLSQKIAVNDQIIEVDGRSLYGYTNHLAVEVLRNTGKLVKLRLARYLRGSKYDQLQQAINHADFVPVKPPVPVKPVSLKGFGEQSILSTQSSELTTRIEPILFSSDPELRAREEYRLKAKWTAVMGNEVEIVVAFVQKFKEGGGLGISLEGTIDLEDGKEVRPHHYIRSILPDGPVGLNGVLQSGDEILEVNGSELLLMNHANVVTLLKELSIDVCMVCARSNQLMEELVDKSSVLDSFLHTESNSTFDTLGLHSISSGERLVKAKSDGSLAVVNSNGDFNRGKSRSLEPLSGLAMWSAESQLIELVKGDRGLGFSILDYQNPLNPNETVIVIRSLVQGGVAQQDGRLIPGDRLLAVNDISLANASLEIAVQALKGAKKGVVRILVAKPLPLAEQNSPQGLSPPRHESFGFSSSEQPPSSIELEQQHPPPLFSSSGSISNADPLQFKLHTNELLDLSLVHDFSRSNATSSNNCVLSHINREDSIAIPMHSRCSTPSASSHLSWDQMQELPLPAELERVIKVDKHDLPLGVILELADDGINGFLVKHVSKNFALYRDGRIQPGDYLLAINNESLRNVTNSKSKAILKRVNLMNRIVMFKYVPANDALVHKHNQLLNRQRTRNGSRRSLPPMRLCP